MNPSNFNRNSRIGKNRQLVGNNKTPLTISEVIESCHANQTIYNVSYIKLHDDIIYYHIVCRFGKRRLMHSARKSKNVYIFIAVLIHF
jgi:hypothetical protein